MDFLNFFFLDYIQIRSFNIAVCKFVFFFFFPFVSCFNLRSYEVNTSQDWICSMSLDLEAATK